MVRRRSVWLVEIKVVYQGNVTRAVREAVAQLLECRYFLWNLGKGRHPEALVALFSEPVGAAYVEFLAELEILCIWRESGTWLGSTRAVAYEIAERTA